MMVSLSEFLSLLNNPIIKCVSVLVLIINHHVSDHVLFHVAFYFPPTFREILVDVVVVVVVDDRFSTTFVFCRRRWAQTHFSVHVKVVSISRNNTQ